jgi:hypothetical protein
MISFGRIRQETDCKRELPLAAVIVTFYSGSSYDSLFRSKPQTKEGGRVSVWHCQLNAKLLGEVISCVRGQPVPPGE